VQGSQAAHVRRGLPADPLGGHGDDLARGVGGRDGHAHVDESVDDLLPGRERAAPG
jgi:hypothetical protein